MIKKIQRKAQRTLVKNVRIAGMCFVTIVLQKPIWWCLQFFPNSFDYVFFIYPGTQSDLDGYMPRWMSTYFRTRLFIGGFITMPKNKRVRRGIIVGTSSTVRDMVSSRQTCEILYNKTLRIANMLSASAIGIAGRGSSIFLHHRLPFKPPFVRGEKGMIFCTIMTLQAVVKKHNITLTEANIVVFGAGRVGSHIASFLTAQNCTVTTVQAQTIFDSNAQKAQNNTVQTLANADIVIVISAKGSNMYPYMKYLQDGAIIIDDTHPRMKRPFKRGKLYRASLVLEGLQFMPPLQAYKGKSVPGCVIEAIVYAVYKSSCNQEEFNARARKIGFKVDGIS